MSDHDADRIKLLRAKLITLRERDSKYAILLVRIGIATNYYPSSLTMCEPPRLASDIASLINIDNGC